MNEIVNSSKEQNFILKINNINYQSKKDDIVNWIKTETELNCDFEMCKAKESNKFNGIILIKATKKEEASKILSLHKTKFLGRVVFVSLKDYEEIDSLKEDNPIITESEHLQKNVNAGSTMEQTGIKLTSEVASNPVSISSNQTANPPQENVLKKAPENIHPVVYQQKMEVRKEEKLNNIIEEEEKLKSMQVLIPKESGNPKNSQEILKQEELKNDQKEKNNVDLKLNESKK